MAAVLSQVPSLGGSMAAHDTVVNPNGGTFSDIMHCNGAVDSPVDSPVNGRDQHSSTSRDQTDIQVEIVNVLCNFKTHCHLDLRAIAMTGVNVEFRRDPSSIVMKLHSPAITSTIWSSGKVICMGARSEAEALVGARRVARKLQKCGFKLRFVDFQVKNVLGIVNLPFGVRIDRLKDKYHKEVSYEPELHPAASWRVPDLGGQLQVFQTGNLSVTAPNVEAAQKTFQAVYPKLVEFKKAKDVGEVPSGRGKKGVLPSAVIDKTKRQKVKSGPGTQKASFGLPAEFEDVDWDEMEGMDTD